MAATTYRRALELKSSVRPRSGAKVHYSVKASAVSEASRSSSYCTILLDGYGFFGTYWSCFPFLLSQTNAYEPTLVAFPQK